MGQFAWVTLATNDSYSLGALVVAHSLKRVHTAHQLAVLVTPGVSESMRFKLASVFDLVEEVNVLDSQDSAHLALLSRPELGITFTKLHCWRLTQYEKCVFLDADTLVIQNCDELFEREELSAAPDVGWPDCFNSGVFVYRPSLDTYGKLLEFAATIGSFDGGDQGLLNQYFSDWSTKDIGKHLPFTYNTTTTAVYSYIPAFKKFGENVKILHFIGDVKPWLQNFDPHSKQVHVPGGYGHVTQFLQLWWNIFCDDVHPKLSPEMNNSRRNMGGYDGSYGNVENPSWQDRLIFLYVPQTQHLLPTPEPNNYNPNDQISFYDPWEDYNEGNNNNNNKRIDIQPCHNFHDNNVFEHEINYDNDYNTNVNCNEYNVYSNNSNININNYKNDNNMVVDEGAGNVNNAHNQNDNHHQQDSSNKNHYESSYENSQQHNPNYNNNNNNVVPEYQTTSINSSTNTTTTTIDSNSQYNNDCANNLSYDSNKNDAKMDSKHKHETGINQPNNQNNTEDVNGSGLAGALAKITLGEQRSAEQEEYENHMRRQCWESGNIDYLGKDSFDNIWRRITKTIESSPVASSAQSKPREKTPQREATPQPEEKLKVEQKKEVVPTLTTTMEEIEEVGAPNQRNVIAVCSPHELMRSLSSPGLAQEQIITTVLPNGKTVTQKILTYPEREIEIEDYERIEILGPVTRTITTETTRIGADNFPKIDTRQITLKMPPGGTQPAVPIQAAPAAPLAIKPATSLAPSAVPKSTRPANSPKIPITAVLAPQPGDKMEFDPATNTTTVTRKTATGYEMIIATVTPDGRNRVQTKTFFDPVEVPGTEEEEEEYTEEQTHENQKTTTTTSTKPGEKKVVPAPQKKPEPVKNTQQVVKTNQTTTAVQPISRPGGIERVVMEVTPDGKTIQKTITTYPGEEEIEEIEETETHTTEGVQTIIHSTAPKEQPKPAPKAIANKPAASVAKPTQDDKTTKTTTKTRTKNKPAEEIEITETEEITHTGPAQLKERKTTIPMLSSVPVKNDDKKQTTSTTIAKTSKPVKVEGRPNTTMVVEQIENGYMEIYTTINSDGTKKVESKTFYNPVDIPGDEEEEIEEYEETTTEEPVVTTKTTKTTTNIPAGNAKVVDDKKTTAVQKVDKVSTAVPAKIDAAKKTTTTNESTKTKNEQTTTVETTGKKTTTEQKGAVQKTTTQTQAAPQKQTPGGTTKDKSTATAQNTKQQVVAAKQPATGEPKTIVTTKRVKNGTEHTITTINPDGTKKVETKTFFDVVDLPGEESEEEIEEYEEVTEEPAVINKKTTTTSTTLPAKPVVDPKKTATAVTPKTAVKKPAAVAAPTSPTSPEPPTATRNKKKTVPSAASPSAAVKEAANNSPVPPPRKKEVIKKVNTGKTDAKK